MARQIRLAAQQSNGSQQVGSLIAMSRVRKRIPRGLYMRLAVKMLASIIASVALVVVVGLSRPHQATSVTHDYPNAEPFRGSEAGKTGSGLRKLPFEPDELALVQPCCAGFAVDPEPRAQEEGGIEFLHLAQLFCAPATCQARFDLRSNLDGQDATLVVHHHASWSKAHGKGQKDCVRLGGNGN